MKDRIIEIISKYNGDSTRLMDILHDIQAHAGYIDEATIALLADKLTLSAAQIKETVSFYHFYSDKPLAKVNIYLNDSVTANMNGRKDVLKAFEDACGIKIGRVTTDGNIGLFCQGYFFHNHSLRVVMGLIVMIFAKDYYFIIFKFFYE